MKAMSFWFACATLVLGVVLAIPTSAQQAPTTGPAANGGRGDFRARMETFMKEQLGATDDEWKAIQPKLEKVLTAQRDMRGGMMGMMGRRNGGGRNNADAQAPQENPSPVATATKDLRDTLDNKDATPAEIKAKLTALRDARAKAADALKAAQKDLTEILTARQEAVLVGMSILE